MTHRHNTLQKHKPMYKNLTQQMQPGKNSNSQKISIPTADDLLEPNITNPTQVRQVLTHNTLNIKLTTFYWQQHLHAGQSQHYYHITQLLFFITSTMGAWPIHQLHTYFALVT